MTYDVAVIGTGANPDDPGPEGYAMAYEHAAGYRRRDDCELVAAADIVRENAEAFAAEFGVDAVFTDYERMLERVEPDVVSVCVPPDAHADLVVGCARSGVVEAVHCEKPMATTWGDCRRMVAACDDAGVRLTFNHQMRFGAPFARAKDLLDDGAIGELRRVEFAEADLFDNGTHLFDLCGYYAGYPGVDWVLAGIDYREENRLFGAHNENQGLAQWRYENGVGGLATTGEGASFADCYLRLVGTEGRIEICDADPPLYLRQDGGERAIDTGNDHIYDHYPGLVEVGLKKAATVVPFTDPAWVHTPRYTERAVDAVVEALRTGERSGLEAANALAATEVIFACWESVRRRGRVDLPLDVEDNPLAAMVERGDLAAAEADHGE